MRTFFDNEMNELNISLVRMSAAVTDSMDNLCRVMDGKTEEGLTAAAELYSEAKMYAAAVEARCVKLLIHQQPVASDLRIIKAALRLIVDMCRITEQAAHAAELNVDFGGYDRPRVMARTVRAQVRSAVESYLHKDASAAKSVAAGDDAVDEIFQKIRRELVEILRANGNNDAWVLDCLLVSKYLERIADHAVNIAEIVGK